LSRELREELGIEVSVGTLIESLTHAYPEKTVRLNFYQCKLLRGEPKCLGCADFKWVCPEELKNFQFPPADERLLGKLQTDSSLWQP